MICFSTYGEWVAYEDGLRKISGVETGGFILVNDGLGMPFDKLNNEFNAAPLMVKAALDPVLFF